MTKILVIDDEPLVCEMLDTVLTRAGHDVTTARDGRRGLAQFEENPARIVISDILMPDMDGLEVITALRKASSDVKIIVISGGSRINQTDLLDTASAFGADYVFRKPLDHSDLLQAIDECLGLASEEDVVRLRPREGQDEMAKNNREFE